jgi:glycosyltransferase involved in cell wall biosynthesis
MKILHINAADKTGGAAIAAFRLHNAMLQQGMDSTYFVLERSINDRADIFTVSYFELYIKRILNKALETITKRTMRSKAGGFSTFKHGINIVKYIANFNPDVIYLHWINNFVNYRTLKQILKTGKPVFWFLHDMFAITGGCHYSFDCAKYQTKCYKCPFHGTGSFLTDLSIRQYRIKHRIYKKFDNLMFIAPSGWLFDCTHKSGITNNNRIYHIPNLIDTEVFKPLNKEMARQLFSLDSKKKIIGFGAHSALTNPYKGWSYLKEALQIVSHDESLQGIQTELLIFGSNYSKEIAESIPFPVHFLGNLYDEYSLAAAYNCIDVFVIPSLAENFPNTILESLACDVPVVGFNTGGIPDTVNEHSGYLAEYNNSADLARGISLLLREKINVNSYVMPFLKDVIISRHKKLWKDEHI